MLYCVASSFVHCFSRVGSCCWVRNLGWYWCCCFDKMLLQFDLTCTVLSLDFFGFSYSTKHSTCHKLFSRSRKSPSQVILISELREFQTCFPILVCQQYFPWFWVARNYSIPVIPYQQSFFDFLFLLFKMQVNWNLFVQPVLLPLLKFLSGSVLSTKKLFFPLSMILFFLQSMIFGCQNTESLMFWVLSTKLFLVWSMIFGCQNS